MNLWRSRVLRPLLVALATLAGVTVVAAPANADYIYNSWYCNTGTSPFYGVTHSCLKGR